MARRFGGKAVILGLIICLFTMSLLTACQGGNTPQTKEGQQATTSVFDGVESPVEEEVVFSFITENERKLIVAYNPAEDKLVYRFFSKDSLELELPDQGVESWGFFSYMDGHQKVALNGKQMDLNYLVFTNGGYRYEIYDNYNVAGGGRVVGVDVIKLSDQSVTHISGDAERAVGSLMLLNEKFPNINHEALFSGETQ